MQIQIVDLVTYPTGLTELQVIEHPYVLFSDGVISAGKVFECFASDCEQMGLRVAFLPGYLGLGLTYDIGVEAAAQTAIG